MSQALLSEKDYRLVLLQVNSFCFSTSRVNFDYADFLYKKKEKKSC